MSYKKSNNISYIILVLLLTSSLFAQNKVGTTAAPFLGIAIGPRAQAMGSAYVADASDVTAAYWNAGALANLPAGELMISRTNWLLGTNFNWLGFSMRLGSGTALAVSLTQLDYGSEPITTLEEQEGTGRFWDAQDLAFGLSLSQALTNRFSIGGTFKYITQRIWNESSSAIALDVGLLFKTNFDGMRLGINISNYGTNMQLDGDDLLYRIDIDPENNGNNETLVARLKTDSYPLPLFFRIGVAYDLINMERNRFTLAMDALHPTDNVEYVNVGGEYMWNNIFALRGGYKALFKEDSRESWTAGLGLQYELFGFGKMRIDYAYLNFIDFSDIQTFAVSYIF